MAPRPSFDLTRVSTADKILFGGALLMFIDTLLPWQRPCEDICFSANAWGGNGAFFGVMLGLFALLLVIGVGMTIAGIALPPGISLSTVVSGLTFGTVLLAVIKFLFVIGESGSYGAWVGLVLAIVIAYGGYLKMQEAKAISPEPDSGFTA